MSGPGADAGTGVSPRQGGRALFWISAVALVAALAAGCVLLAQRPPPLASGRLPDGSVLSLEAVTYGKSHRAFEGARWLRLAAAVLPPSLAERLGSPVLTETTETDQPV